MPYSAVYPNPKKPDFKLPSHACDAHCHVFGPAKNFPYARERKYTPIDAPKEKLFALHQHLGFERSVLVQASCHGTDNSAMLDMLKAGQGRYRGVAVVGSDISDEELLTMHHAGVRGIRFNFVKRLVDIKPVEYYQTLAKRIAKLDWHVVVYFESQQLADLEELLKDLQVPLVIDHMGRPDINKGIAGQDFQRICNLLSDHPNTWVKVGCHERLTNQESAGYKDVIPFAKHLVEMFASQVLWGTDWPHPNMKSHMPDDGALVDNIPAFAVTKELQKKLLVENPHRLYEFDD
ncbi:MAG: amidohydrolase family protein [Arenicellaceae bacterium]|nr:amidohydrolase family protein [Arenicellaceae bacterium]